MINMKYWPSAMMAILYLLIPNTPSQAAHGVDLYGSLKYPADFQHFDYVNPDAPKGGSLSLAIVGSFDSLNPFIIKGVPAAGMGPLFGNNFTLFNIG